MMSQRVRLLSQLLYYLDAPSILRTDWLLKKNLTSQSAGLTMQTNVNYIKIKTLRPHTISVVVNKKTTQVLYLRTFLLPLLYNNYKWKKIIDNEKTVYHLLNHNTDLKYKDRVYYKTFDISNAYTDNPSIFFHMLDKYFFLGITNIKMIQI